MEEASALNLEEGATVYKYLEALLRKIRKETLRVYILTAEETKFVFENTDRISGCGKEYASRIHQLVAEITEAIDCYVDLRRKTAHKDLPPASGLRPMGLFEHFMHNVSLDLKNQLLVQAVATNPQFVTELVARMPEPMQSE